MARPVKYNKPRTTKFSEVQDCTLNKLASFNINVDEFIRQSTAEKIKREYQQLITKPKKSECPF